MANGRGGYLGGELLLESDGLRRGGQGQRERRTWLVQRRPFLRARDPV